MLHSGAPLPILGVRQHALKGKTNGAMLHSGALLPRLRASPYAVRQRQMRLQAADLPFSDGAWLMLTNIIPQSWGLVWGFWLLRFRIFILQCQKHLPHFVAGEYCT